VRKRLSLFAALMILPLTGCEVVMMGVATPMIVQQKRVNLPNASYAAVDVLVQQGGKHLSRETPLIVPDLQEIVDRNQKSVTANPKVGKVMGEQMRTRFEQLGYTLLPPGAYAAGKAGRMEGTYRFNEGTMFVSMRLYNPAGKLIATNDYALPVTYDIKKYMTRSANDIPPLPPLFSEN
jgi:hypothetical protein